MKEVRFLIDRAERFIDSAEIVVHRHRNLGFT